MQISVKDLFRFAKEGKVGKLTFPDGHVFDVKDLYTRMSGRRIEGRPLDGSNVVAIYATHRILREYRILTSPILSADGIEIGKQLFASPRKTSISFLVVTSGRSHPRAGRILGFFASLLGRSQLRYCSVDALRQAADPIVKSFLKDGLLIAAIDESLIAGGHVCPKGDRFAIWHNIGGFVWGEVV